MGKAIMARLADMNITAREFGTMLFAIAGIVGWIISTQTTAAKTAESVNFIKESITEIKSEQKEIKSDQKEIREEIKLTNDRIDRVLTLKF